MIIQSGLLRRWILGLSILGVAPFSHSEPQHLWMSSANLFVGGRLMWKVSLDSLETDLVETPFQNVQFLTGSAQAVDPRLLVLTKEALWRSEHNQTQWTRIRTPAPNEKIRSLAVANSDSNTLYAAIFNDGLWRSSDGGMQWEFVMDRPWKNKAEHEILSLTSVALDTGMGGHWLYAGTSVGLLRVPDCFCRWQSVTNPQAMDQLVQGVSAPPPESLPENVPVLQIVASTQNPTHALARLAHGVWMTSNAGVDWIKVLNTSVDAIAIHPSDPRTIAVLIESQLTISRDGGALWTPVALTEGTH